MSYEVAVACDVKLGDFVRDNPEVNSIDIDLEALNATLQILEQGRPNNDEEPQELLFLASSYESMHSTQNEIVLGNFTKKKQRSFRNPKSVTCKIRTCVAGAPDTFLRMSDDELQSYTSQQAELLAPGYRAAAAQNPEIDSLAYVTNLADAIIASVKADKPAFEAADSIQQVAVHELSHAVDRANRAANRVERWHGAKIAAKDWVTGTAVIYGTAFSGYGVDEEIGYHPNLPVQLALYGLVPAVVAYQAMKRIFIRPEVRHRRYLASPTEARARQLEADALEYPTIIRLQ
ncbi:MAG: hypothetical protein JWN38_1166 [Candidatus Saccharibacteria bacterium]|nr:hypothetical protein [Candidatus Saccharibacteria bacterium]